LRARHLEETVMLRPALAFLALLGLAACETTAGASGGPTVDPQAQTVGEAINEPTDGVDNEISVE
jgi:hypothetical protein